MKIKKMRPFSITMNWLVEKGACQDQRAMFRKLFGTRVRVTEELLRKHGAKFQLDWLVYTMLGDKDDILTRMRNDSESLWSKYWDDVRALERPFRETKRGLPRVRVDFDAMRKARVPLARKRDKADIEIAIEALRSR